MEHFLDSDEVEVMECEVEVVAMKQNAVEEVKEEEFVDGFDGDRFVAC